MSGQRMYENVQYLGSNLNFNQPVILPHLSNKSLRQSSVLSDRDSVDSKPIEDLVDFAISSKRVARSELVKQYEHKPTPPVHSPRKALASTNYFSATSPTTTQLLLTSQGAIVIPTRALGNKSKRKKKNTR